MLLKRLKDFRQVRLFFIEIGLAVSLIIVGIFLGIYIRTDYLLLQSLRGQADSYFDLIIHTRQWNASTGGIYVRKGPGVETNPYLRKLGVEPEIVLKDGTVMTLRNPALMTREISEIIAHQGDVRFHLTSLNLVNPQNVPDSFEAEALKKFGQGSKEEYAIGDTGDGRHFRLIRPLFVEKPCLKCHESQGYKLGDLRGALSVSIPVGSLENQLKINSYIIISLGFLTIALLIGTLYIITVHLAKRLQEAQQRIVEISITDELTGLRNRRYIMGKLAEEFERSKRTGRPLGALMLDLDFFKNVNDTYGHPFGDVVLKTAAARIKMHLRPYDMAGRFGGEEFLIVCPDVTHEDVAAIAERIRHSMMSEKISDGTHEITLTTSIGITASNEYDTGIESLLKRADDALYRAKRNGRDRVEEL